MVIHSLKRRFWGQKWGSKRGSGPPKGPFFPSLQGFGLVRPRVLVLLAVAVLAGCAEERVSEVTLEQLSGAPAAFDGERVRTQGTVQAIEDPEHYWIETTPRNRLAIRPGSAVANHVGDPVVVEGRFSWHPEEGRRLQVDSVMAADVP